MAEPIKYTLKTDPMGMAGRECPKCKSYFKVPLKETECEEMTCPVCGQKRECKKFTTDEQIDYINSVIFHKNECPIDERQDYSKVKPCHDYVEMPAKCVWMCDVCGKMFGMPDKKPDFCPICGASMEHLHLENKCDFNPPEAK
jgi:rRNA maturation endonuclease Nob1